MATVTDNSQSVLSRINMRMVILAVVVLLVLGWPVMIGLQQYWTGGIVARGDYLEVNLKAMGDFSFSEIEGTVADVPKKYAELDGKKLLLVGQMYADQSSAPSVDRFQLVYSIQNCCFNGPPKVQERVFAQVPPRGRKVPVFGGLTKVYGTLHVRAVRENGRVVSLYDLDVEKVEELRN